MITAENAKLLTESSKLIEKEVTDMLKTIEDEIKSACLQGDNSVAISAYGFADYHISEQQIQIRKQVLDVLDDSGFTLDISGFDSANKAYFRVMWG